MNNNREALRGFAEMMNVNYMDYVPMLSDNDSMEEFKSIFNTLLHDGETKERMKTNLDYMKELLEGIIMPVYNEKTGEYDTVDLALASKIKIDNEYLVDMSTNKDVDVTIRLEGHEANETIYVVSESAKIGKAVHEIPVQTFEEILFRTINDTKEQRLEETEEFASITASLVERLVADNKKKHVHYAVRDNNHVADKGIGVITDTKTSHDIGTFESITYIYGRGSRDVVFENIILSGRTMNDLSENDRYNFTFYSLDGYAAFSFIADHQASIILQEDGHLKINDFSLVTDTFEKEISPIYNMIEEAEAAKHRFNDITKDHPLYDVNLQEFRGTRLQILESSKERYKTEKLVSQFADIDLF